MADNEKSGDKPEKAEKGNKPEKAPKGERPPKPEKGAGEKSEKGDKPEKGEKKGGGEGKKDKGPKGGGKAKGDQGPEKPRPAPRLLARYKKEVISALKKELNLKSVSEVPRLEKIVVNMGLGVLDLAVDELSSITGQRAVVTKAKKSIANFKLREGMPIGAMVTLRRATMWEFLDRLIAVALPRLRDFKGVSDKAFDGRGNYTLGIKEQIIFPEIEYDKVDKVRGMNICICTSAKNDLHGRALLTALGMPFRRRGQEQAHG
jgi:large subunit ribosomal protein L5